LSVNDPPVVDSLSFNIAENIPIGTQLDTLSVFDIDSDKSLMRDWTIIDGDSIGHFNLNDTTGILSTNAILNFEDTPVYTISVTVSDNIDTSPTQKMLIQLTDIEEGVLVNKEGEIVTSEYGESDTFTVVLQSLPFDSVTVNLSSSDSTEAFLSLDSLVFAPELWSTPQIVTITGIEDSINDPNISYSIILDSTLSSDPNYNGLDVPDLSATNLARDVYGPTVELFGSPGLIAAGNPLKVTATIKDNNSVSQALLYFALGGNSNYDELIMGLSEDDQYQVTIPSVVITYRGISYYISASDTIGNESESDIFSVNVKFAEGDLSTDIEGSVLKDSLPRNKWRMISIPADLDVEDVETVLEVALGEKTLETWVVKQWDGIAFTESETFLEGEGYWFIHDVDAPPSFETGSGTSPDQSGFTFKFDPGWNMIGNPYPFTTSFELSDSLFSGPMTYGWTVEGWSDETDLRPWAGYAVFNKSASVEAVTLKPVEISTSLYRGIEVPVDGWQLNLSAYGETYVDPNNAIGRISGSSEQLDYRDNPEPPYLGGHVSLVMPRKEWNENISNFTSDIRSLDEENGIWDIELRVKEETGPVSLSLAMEGVFPIEHDIVLLDLFNREIHDVNEIPSVTFEQPWDKLSVYPFKVIAGTPEYVSSMTQEILS
ncbi:MAG: cadherin domain-containing protein, partial [Candidatus Marinimicrobia bacterium]|nr:cadherin domain-containing protein [Candidatus Neomarinimicrobiota bacterium]